MKIEELKEAFKTLSLWGCKFEDTVFYDIYCKNEKMASIWREVGEELPPVNELVIVRVRNKNKPDGIYLYDVCYIDEDTNSWGDRLHTWEDIIEWKFIN